MQANIHEELLRAGLLHGRPQRRASRAGSAPPSDASAGAAAAMDRQAAVDKDGSLGGSDGDGDGGSSGYGGGSDSDDVADDGCSSDGGSVSSEGMRELQYDDLVRLTYLNAVIDEAMRLWPVAATASVRCVAVAVAVPPAGWCCCGWWLLRQVTPGGCMVGP